MLDLFRPTIGTCRCTSTTKEMCDVHEVENTIMGNDSTTHASDLGLVDLDGLADERLKHDYDGFKTRQRGILVHELWHYVYDRKKKGCVQFYLEFAVLKSGIAHLHEVAKKQENKHKNRYKGLYAYDHSRVKLGVDNGESDYINASYINGFGKLSKFIACQGPTEATIQDVWLMVWQQKTEQIVMLTSLTEKGAIKCSRYWPYNGSKIYGKLNVRLTSTRKSPEYTIRQLELSVTGQQARTVTQYQYECWPDKEVPDTTWSLVEFWRTVMKHYNTTGTSGNESGPIVVHCSAGVGRTGTFIALDNLYQQAETEGCVTPVNIVDLLRDQRVCMVQTKEQYAYLHEAVADALLLSIHDVKPRYLQAIHNFLLETDDKDPSMSRLEVQHQLILSSRKYDQNKTAETSPNLEEPEYSNLKFTVPITGEDTQQRLSSITLPYHSGMAGFILVNRPTKDTSDQLWSLITDRDIKTIVTISGPSGEEKCSRTVLEVKNSDVEIIEEKVTDDYVADTFRIPRRGNPNAKVSSFDLKFFALKFWDEHTGLPPSATSLLRCVDSLRTWQSQLSDKEPILVICRDNVRSAGLFSIILSEIDRCSGHIGMVNIVEAVQIARARNADIMDSVDHYKFIFDVLTEFIKHQHPCQDVWI